MHVRQGIQATFVFFFSKNAFYPNQTFLCLYFSQYALRRFKNVLKRVFLNFLFFAIHNYHLTNVTNLLLLISNYDHAPSSKLLVLSRFSGPKVPQWLLWPNQEFFQYSSSYDIPLVKDESNFYEIPSLAISINIKSLNRVNTAEHPESIFRLSEKPYCCLLKMIQH